MAIGPDPTPAGRPATARPSARARVVAAVGSVGALVGITADIALAAEPTTAEVGSSPSPQQQARPTRSAGS